MGVIAAILAFFARARAHREAEGNVDDDERRFSDHWYDDEEDAAEEDEGE